MFLFKASGTTYRLVLKHKKHAFSGLPSEVNGHELVLLSKNREDCRDIERQIQYVAKLLCPRATEQGELEQLFPAVGAGARWRYLIELYWVRRLIRPFNLNEVTGLNWARYKTVQGFARLASGDDMAVLNHLAATNPDLLLDIINNASPEELPPA